jgi:hypothetical protein
VSEVLGRAPIQLSPRKSAASPTRDQGRRRRAVPRDTPHPEEQEALFFGAVQVKKSYVSYHLMPVYLKPELLDPVSPALTSRMQGKSCFNFAVSEPGLFKELAALTTSAFASYNERGFV